MAEVVYIDTYMLGKASKEIEVRVEGTDEFVGQQAAHLIEILKNREAGVSPCHCQPGKAVDIWKDGKQTDQAAEQVKTGTVEHDVVAIYDDAGIPSIMHRFRRMTDKELFRGSEKVHPAFIIGGEVYDEIYISVYENTMINGKPYSLPFMKPKTNITIEDFAQACFSKGEGWHCLTAAEWGLLANISLKNRTLPHGNTDRGSYHANTSEHGEIYDNYYTLTGSGPATWTHDHTQTGVHDLCGNIWEFCRGMRIKNGTLYAARDNNAALPETDLSGEGAGWEPVKDNEGRTIRASVGEDRIRFTTDDEINEGYDGREWGDVEMDCESEQLKELAFFCGEPGAYCCVDSTEGEYILLRGGNWVSGAYAGVFHSNLSNPRSFVYTDIGGRSAYFKKH